MKHPKLPRRDLCHLVGKRAQKLDPTRAAYAWYYVAGNLDAMDTMDMPKFRHLLQAIRKATILSARLDITHPINFP